MTPLGPRDAGSARSPGAYGGDVSLLSIGSLVLRHRRLVISAGLATAVLVAAVTLLRPRTYTSTTSFVPQNSNSGMSRLSGFAAQFGFTMPTSDAAMSPAFYASLLKSDEVLRRVVSATYEITEDGRRVRGTLVKFFAAAGRTPEQRRDDAVKSLLEDMVVSTGRETGIVELEVSTPSPELSQAVASYLMQLVSEFNLRRRQTNAGAERRFVEGRLRETRDSLEAAQAQLQRFLQRNREFRNAPQLVLEYDRLQRDVQLRQEVYSTLMQSYEQARIDEVRNTPVITVIESADLPSLPDPRWTVVKTALGLLVGSLFGAVIAAFWDIRTQSRNSGALDDSPWGLRSGAPAGVP